MKRRTKVIALATSLLVGVSMIGVGFATWVISNTDKQEATGNVKAESVTDNYVKLTVANLTGNNVVYGGLPAEKKAELTSTGVLKDKTLWLTNDATTESLTVNFTVTIEGQLQGLTIAFASTEGKFEAMAAAGKNYVDGPSYKVATADESKLTGKIAIAENGAVTVTDGDFSTAVTFGLEVTFKWGSAFGSVNPFEYYNQKDAGAYVTGTSGDTWHEQAYKYLNELYTSLGSESGTNFTFTFTAVGGSSN